MYSKLYRNLLYPFYETALRGRKTLRYLDELEKSQWYPREQLKELQWAKVMALLNHAYNNVPFYKERFDKSKIHPGDIRNPDDFKAIPFLTKEDIRNNQETLLARTYKDERTFNTATGGSTGAPLRLKLDHNNYEWRQAAVKRVYGWAGYKDGEKTVFIWGGSVGKEDGIAKAKHGLDEWLKRHKIYNTFNFRKDDLGKYLNEITRYKPKVIVGYTSPLYYLAKFMKETGEKACRPGSIICAAEKLYHYQRILIEEAFGCPVFETYGCREVTSIAGECHEHKGMHINMENVYVEIDDIPLTPALSPEGRGGSLGEIVITDLTNYCMPLIRYKNEDLGVISENNCRCGRGLVLLEKVEGRILDTIRTSDGRIIPGEFFPHLMKEFEEVEQFQVVQEDISSLRIKIVRKEIASPRPSAGARNDGWGPSAGLAMTGCDLELMKKEIYKVMGDKISINFEFVDEIPLTATGKFRVVTSKVTA